MIETTLIAKPDIRKRTILVAALKCFLQFGYAKTSMEDVAREANLSRPLLYLKFKNKEDLYIGVIEHMAEGRREAVEQAIASSQTRKQKLLRIFEIYLLEPWEQMIGKPMSADFYKTYINLFQTLVDKYQQQTLLFLQGVLTNNLVAETFLLSVEGLKSDLPDTAVLRQRLLVLIDHFIT